MSASNRPSSAQRLEATARYLHVAADTGCASGGRSRHDLDGDWTSDPGDEAILDFAQRDSRVLVTLDKDFGELAVVFGKPHCGIVRLVDLDPSRQAFVCDNVLVRYGAELTAGAIVTVTPDRTRLRPADAPEDPLQSDS